ncbi:hypothetical protein AAT19DRAFT_11296 [Rhodotorula toruloides]|uniref:Uncharacterized protein n=1 Tax=Rhodotorula toruloides TaxID=5286 RepID=A0A2S9ZXS8_RHOTO|nr:hypothetical protein AAT19DRAFT_11296 [Rhodotorula toruloides]
MAPFPSFTGPPAEPKTIRIPTFRSPTAKTQPAPVPQNRDEARAARLKTNGEGQWASLDALASAGPSSLAHLLAKRDPSTSRPTASSSSSRAKPIPQPFKKAAAARKSPRKSGVQVDVARTVDAGKGAGEAAPPVPGPSKPTKRLPRASAFPKNSISTANATPGGPPSPVNNGSAPSPQQPPAASTSASTKKPRKSSAKPKKDAQITQGDEEGAANAKKALKRKSVAVATAEGGEHAEEAEKLAKKRRSSIKGKGKAEEVEQDPVEEKVGQDEAVVPVARKARQASKKKSETVAAAAAKPQKEPKRRRSTRVAEPAAASPPPPSPPVDDPAEEAPTASAPKKKRARKSAVQADEREEAEQEEPKPKKVRKSRADAASAVEGNEKSRSKEKGKGKAVMPGDDEKPEAASRAVKRKRNDITAAAPEKAAKRRPVPAAASASTSRKQPVASTSRPPARRARSPTPDSTSGEDADADAGDKSKKKGIKVRTERLKGNKGKLNVFDVVAGGTRRVLDQFLNEHGKNPRMLKLLHRFASNVQSPLLSRVRRLSSPHRSLAHPPSTRSPPSSRPSPRTLARSLPRVRRARSFDWSWWRRSVREERLSGR